ncbi:hypothetical protein A2U01_0106848, partial [Trifolium medium]|nr:hypothetical protein [Trifolium medium]
MQGFLPPARRAGSDGVLRRDAEDVWRFFCQLCAAQGKDGASRQLVERKVESFCHLRVAQERMA